MNYTTRFTPEQTRDAHGAWSHRFAASRTRMHSNTKDSNRKLRIGYVSPDLKRHSVAYFLEPILEHRDRGRFEVFLYSNTDLADEVTARLRTASDHWRDIRNESDDRAAEIIAADRIDILIDLAGHTTGNRLGVFARRPAPVQITYLGYPNTTGSDAIDYRIVDELTDPLGMTESHNVERLLRVPAPFICYRAPENAPPVADPPIVRNGFPTFGSFNKGAKVGRECIELWSRVLREIPTARLIIKSRGVGSEGSRQRIHDGFASHQIDPARVQLVEANQALSDHLAMYGEIDVALDTFPYHGTTTTCEAMWMGVPVVTLAGRIHVSRVGVSLLTSIGLTDHIAHDPNEFTAIAQRLTQPTMSRQSLRDRLAASPLCDGARLARSLETAYRQAFTAWSQSGV
jgi:predicted O-linked N-acetylglucosamine transferase (SPINDLY family)